MAVALLCCGLGVLAALSPWIVRNYMTVEEAATENQGVWITFLAVVGIYGALGVTTILVLRGMSRRWRDRSATDDTAVPYGPRQPVDVRGAASDEEVPVG